MSNRMGDFVGTNVRRLAGLPFEALAGDIPWDESKHPREKDSGRFKRKLVPDLPKVGMPGGLPFEDRDYVEPALPGSGKEHETLHRSRLGDVGEAAAKLFGVSLEHRADDEAIIKAQHPIDGTKGDYAFEIKTRSTAHEEYRIGMKRGTGTGPQNRDEIGEKIAESREMGKKPALIMAIYDHESGDVWLYWREGMYNGRLGEDTDWKFIGQANRKDLDLPPEHPAFDPEREREVAPDEEFDEFKGTPLENWEPPKERKSMPIQISHARKDTPDWDPDNPGFGNTVEDVMENDSKSKKVAEGIGTASKAIQKVHRWPDDIRENQPRGRVVSLNDKRVYGDFSPTDTGGGDWWDRHDRNLYRINRTDPAPGLTMVHELGHGLDYGILKETYGGEKWHERDFRGRIAAAAPSASQQALVRAQNHHEAPKAARLENKMDELMSAIYETKTTQHLNWMTETNQGGKMAIYMMRGTELFARAYEQYIVKHAGDDDLTDQFLADLDKRVMSGSMANSNWYWTWEEFKAIDGAMTALLQDLNLDKEPPAYKLAPEPRTLRRARPAREPR